MRRNHQPKVTRPIPSAIFINRGHVGANRFNRKFNTRRKSLERWHDILDRLNSFQAVISNYDGATPDEIRDLKRIHSTLYELKRVAEKRIKGAMNLEVLRQGI